MSEKQGKDSAAPLSSDSNHSPLQALGFPSRQQKRSFVPDSSNLVLKGSVMSPIMRDVQGNMKKGEILKVENAC